jgi:hypothetical protein
MQGVKYVTVHACSLLVLVIWGYTVFNLECFKSSMYT